MPSREPPWWYLPQPTLTARLLAPAAALYGTIGARRMQRPPSATSPLPVVCIGNFTAGGTGKTPLALLVADRLMQRGLTPVFLTRGYGSRARHPTVVDPARHVAADVGDEALLLARAACVMVAPDRPAGARAIQQRPGADLIIMDDGLQNPSLAKDLRIAVVDGARGFGNSRVIPAGPLRAPLAVQLAHTDIVVVNGRREDRDSIARAVAPAFTGPVLSAQQMPAGESGWLAGTPVVAFAGIGNPQRFFQLLKRLGAHVVEERSFTDHHAFTNIDAADLLAAAQRLGAILVTTEKDLVRLAGASGARGELARSARPLAITTAFHDDGEDRLIDFVLEALTRRQRARQPLG
ncbi:MAG: tetraacyldisaccharide 4'-kinase [Hyphomicrobium sp.]|nr:tetraacyldisaccharide 4'-kinase [Hyphomicrobium sp.]